MQTHRKCLRDAFVEENFLFLHNLFRSFVPFELTMRGAFARRIEMDMTCLDQIDLSRSPLLALGLMLAKRGRVGGKNGNEKSPLRYTSGLRCFMPLRITAAV